MVFLALDAWNGSTSQVGSFISATGITYPVLSQASSVASTYGLSYDTVFIVGGDGTIGMADATGFNAESVRSIIGFELTQLPVPTTAESFGSVKALFNTP